MEQIKKKRKGLKMAVISRIRHLQRTENLDQTIIGNLRLANKLQVNRMTVWYWRERGDIRGKELAPNIWEYHLGEVITDLEKIM
jgi:hypothetical protein